MKSFFLLPTLLLLCAASAHCSVVATKLLAPGITWTQEIDKDSPLIINVVTVDLDTPGVQIGVGVGQDHVNDLAAGGGREDVTRIALRHGALAAINADYFPYAGDPLGLGIKDDELFSEPFPGKVNSGPRVALGVVQALHRVFFGNLAFYGDLEAADGQHVTITGVDREAGQHEIVAYTPIHGETVAGRTGGVMVVIGHINLPIRPNKLLQGTVLQVLQNSSTPANLPDDGMVISASPGTLSDSLAQHFRPGDPVRCVFAIAPPQDTRKAVQIAMLPRDRSDLPSRDGEDISREAWIWSQVDDAVGGGPRLLQDGQLDVDGAAEGFDDSFCNDPNPRTAVGTSEDGRKLIMVTVDGRQAISRGVGLTELASIMKRYGAWNAMNFDGGGSTSLAIAGRLVNNPEGSSYERPVADMLMVYSDHWLINPQREVASVPTPVPSTPAAVPTGPIVTTLTAANAGTPTVIDPLEVGSTNALVIVDGKSVIGGSAPLVVWQGPATNDVGFVDQDGFFTAEKPGTGQVSVLYQGNLISATITVAAGPSTPVVLVDTIHADLAADPGGDPQKSVIEIVISDQNNKPLATAPVHVEVTGGTVDNSELVTDPDGKASANITWYAATGGTAAVSSGTIPAATVTRP